MVIERCDLVCKEVKKWCDSAWRDLVLPTIFQKKSWHDLVIFSFRI
jgi:hypothetical protein